MLELLGSLNVTMSRVNSIIEKHENKPAIGEVPVLTIHDVLAIRERTEKTIDDLLAVLLEAVDLDESMIHQIMLHYCSD